MTAATGMVPHVMKVFSMNSARFRLLPALAAASLGLTGTALLAQPGWGGPGWGGSGWGDSGWDRRAPRSTSASPEGKIEVARFRSEDQDAAQLTRGSITVIRMPGEAAEGDPRLDATFEAAVEDQLLRSGYQAAGSAPGDQIAEVRIVRVEAVPAEEKRNPVSGEMSMGVSNRGSMLGMAVHIDGTKPRKALLSTRLEARIKSRATGAVLWEGRAEIYTRDGDERWNDDAVAARLARALFDGFPQRTGESRERR